MGIDQGFILQPGSIDGSLKCPICKDVFDRPVHARDGCDHTFCRSCAESALRENPRCPACRNPMQSDQLQPSLPMQLRVDEVLVRCSRHLCGCPGCPWTGRLGDRASHDKECKFNEFNPEQDRILAQLQGDITEIGIILDRQERRR